MQISTYFDHIQEPYAAGFFFHEEASLFRRYCDALANFYAKVELQDYPGGKLYPSGALNFERRYAVHQHYHATFNYHPGIMAEKCEIPEYRQRLEAEMRQPDHPPTPHTVGGYTWTHSMPNYERVEQEGLDRYRARLEARPKDEFSRGLLTVLDGIRVFHTRSLEKLRAEQGDPALIRALEQVPFHPARTLYEAMVCRNFVYYLDGCDDPGRLDTELYPYYKGEDLRPVFVEFFDNVDANNGWSAALGPDYNALTIQLLDAIHGKRRPSLELRVTESMPDEVWAAACRAVKAGGGSPCFYNEARYQELLARAYPEVSPADRLRFNGGGCTETMLAGISRVGSTDAGINTALVFAQVLRTALPEAGSFDEFYQAVLDEIQRATDDTLDKVEQIYRSRAKILPQPIRTLLIDDCIDNGLDFNAGGARVNGSVINFAGMINVIDSLLAVRELVFETKEYTPEALIAGLDRGEEELYARLKKCPCFGVDDEKADALAADFSRKVFSMTDGRTPVLGGKYMPGSIQFTTYVSAGKGVAATPDGRHAGDPLCDSVGAIHGKDKAGPTALINSVSKLALDKALATPVFNLKMRTDHIDTALRPLVASFFEKGGMQVQVSCVSRADMEDALIHPEKHENLIVRVGGYSEYFNRLSPQLKQSVIDRTEY